MKINRNNYEPYFIDYLEGNLDVSLVDDFIEFLTKNPDLKEELSMFSPVAIEPATLEFGKKDLLYKERFDLESEFDKAAVASLEGDLNPVDKAELEAYISKHPEKMRELKLFGHTRLVPDESVIFQKKNALYKTTTLKAIFYWSGRAAAVLVIALLAYFFIGKFEKPAIENTPVAVVNSNKTGEEPSAVTKNAGESNNLQQMAQAKTPSVKTVKNPVEIILSDASEAKEQQLVETTEVLATTENEPVYFAAISPAPATIEPEIPETTLETMYITIPQTEPAEERFLLDVVKEKTGIEKISFSKITKAGLNLFANISNEKFRYETDNSGKVTEIIYDSRLLAFSIPTTRNPEKTGE